MSASEYECVNIQVAEVQTIMQNSRFSLHNEAYRDFLRELKGLIWEQESKISGIQTSIDANA
jgi:hypothetical protein